MATELNIHANGIDFSCLEYGPKKGPLVLCFHGFPDTATTWSGLATVLSTAGYRVVAPHMRGYFPTSVSESNGYSAVDLGNDVIALIEALGYESAVVVGHDWGAMAAYIAANMAPERIDKLVTLAIPHPGALKPSVRGLWRGRHFVGLQFKASARKFLMKNNFSGVDEIYRRWSPEWQFSAADLADVKQALGKPGRVDAALGYYWSFKQDGFLAKNNEAGNLARAVTSVPNLTLVGDKDGALDMRVMKNTPRCFSANYDYKVIKGAGHFLHLERPAEVAGLISRFLEG